MRCENAEKKVNGNACVYTSENLKSLLQRHACWLPAAMLSSLVHRILSSQRLNMWTIQENAKASLPAVKQTPLIHAASISLFVNYRQPAQVIYVVITVSTSTRLLCQYNCICTAVPTLPNRSGIPPRSDTVLCSVDTYVRTMNYTERGSDFEYISVSCIFKL